MACILFENLSNFVPPLIKCVIRNIYVVIYVFGIENICRVRKKKNFMDILKSSFSMLIGALRLADTS